MSTVGAFVAQLLHLALVLAAAPVVVGLVHWFRARLEGRPGPSPVQAWRDLQALLRKRPVLAENASPVSQAAPYAAVAALAVALAGMPSFTRGMLLAPMAELLLVAALLAAARAAAVLAAMDVGAATGGLAAARGAALWPAALPALLLAVLALAVPTGGTNLDAVAAAGEGGAGLRAPSLLAVLALAAVAVADTGEGAPPEASGRHLALWHYAAALRLTLWLSFLAALLPPHVVAPGGSGPLAWAAGLLAWGLKLGVLCLAVALFRHRSAALRAGAAPIILGAATLLAALAATLLLLGTGPT